MQMKLLLVWMKMAIVRNATVEQNTERVSADGSGVTVSVPTGGEENKSRVQRLAQTK